MPGEPAVLIVGPVTWDRFPGREGPGGTVSYAARTAAAMGIRAHVLTVAAPGADLSALEGHEVCVVPAARTMTFEHVYNGAVRTLRVTAAPNRVLRPADLPANWPAPEVLIVAPLVDGDIDADGFAEITVRERGVTGQGFLRTLDDSGAVQVAPFPSPSLIRSISADTSVFLSNDEIARWPSAATHMMACRARRVVVTLGARGAEIRTCLSRQFIEPIPAKPVDSTGAGDVFATAFILAVGDGEVSAARLAAGYAAAAVEVIGPGPLPDRAAIEQRLRSG